VLPLRALLLLAAFLCCGYALAQQTNPIGPNNANKGADNVSSNKISVINDSIISIQDSLKSIAANEAANQNAQNDQAVRDSQNYSLSVQDLQAQQDMAKYARFTFATACIGLFVSVITIALLGFSVCQTRVIIKQTRRLGEAQVRAYLSVTDPKCSLAKDGTIKAAISGRNFGNSPAADVQVMLCISVESLGDQSGTQSQSPAFYLSEIAPIDFGDIHAGENFPDIKPIQFMNVKIPQKLAGDGYEKFLGGGMWVAIFGRDVFNEEIFTVQKFRMFRTNFRMIESGDVPYSVENLPFLGGPDPDRETFIKAAKKARWKYPGNNY
jgi:hypothetical protein